MLSRRFSRAVLALLLILPLTLLTPGHVLPVKGAAEGLAEWTLLLYCDADCDLEEVTIEQLAKLTSVGGNKDVNIILLVDRSPQGEEEDGYSGAPLGNVPDWTGAKLLRVERGKFVQIGQDWGKVNLADPRTLVNFTFTAARLYPAKKYALFLGDHGMAWPGVCFDDSHDEEGLTLPRLSSALQQIHQRLGKIELLGFDACLMANLETAHAVAPYARYMVASEELEPNNGWDYPPLLKALNAKPTMNGAELGKVICDTYRDQFRNSDDPNFQDIGMTITLSVVDLEKVNDVVKAVDGLAQRGFNLIKDEERKGWLKLAKVRSRAEEYGADEESEGVNCHDLVHLAQLLRKQDPAAGKVCDALEKAMKSAVLHNVHGKSLPNAHGLSIYFPRNGEQMDESTHEDYLLVPMARTTSWATLLKKFVDMADEDTDRPQLEEVKVNRPTLELGKKESVLVTSGIDADDVDRVNFVLASKQGENKLILGQTPVEPTGDGKLTERWDGKWFGMGNDAAGWVVCTITGSRTIEGEEGAELAEVPAQVRKKGQTGWIDVTLSLYLQRGATPTGRFVAAYTHSTAGPRQVKIEPGDAVRAIYLRVNPKGRQTHVASDQKGDILPIKKKGDLQVAYRALPAGAYRVGFSVQDLCGLVDEEDVEVTLK